MEKLTNLTVKPPKISKKQKKLNESYFLNEFSMEFVGKNKMSTAEKRVMHARICMVCTIYAFYHCVNSFVTNDMSAARIAFGFAIYSGFLAKDGIEILIHFPQIAGFLFFSAEFSRILESGYFKRENISTSKSNLKMKNLRLQSWASFRQFL